MTRRLAIVAISALLAGGACSYRTPPLEAGDAQLAQSSKVYAADGSLLTALLAEENRENVPLADLPAHVTSAVIAIEDARFWSHRGVDAKAILRAAITNASEGEIVEGGSTISQQYVKNTFLDPDRNLRRKLEEAVLAMRLERSYTKERILELYLNTIYFGNGAYGIQAAAEEYFAVPASELDLAQAATLAGIIRAPSAFDPYAEPDAAVKRRNQVLDRMDRLKLAEPAAIAAARSAPLGLREPAAHDRYPAAHFVERVKRFILDDPRFGATAEDRRQLLFTGGLRIFTTIDLDMQARAEEAVGRVRPQPPGPEAALVAVDPRSGFVRALVGGRDFFSGDDRAKLDLASGGPGRPAGSAFKPLVLAAALEEGTPLGKVYAAPSRIRIPLAGTDWEVENYEGSGGGRATLREATVRSYNTVYAQLIQEVGPADAVAMAGRLGVDAPLAPYPSAVLGTNNVRPLDMAASYATFANRGLRVPPTFVTKVIRADGTLLYQHRHRQERVLAQHLADTVTDVLGDVVERGTGVAARIGRPVAGKTGTGQEWRDAWFVGYTPDLVTAVWMGFADEGRRSMVPPATPMRVTGGSWPAQIFQLFMSAALAEVPVSDFAEPRPPSERPDGPLPSDIALLPRLRNLVGMPVFAAVQALERDGYVAEVREVPDDDYPPGYVVFQQPGRGAPLAGGSVVVLHVANGERSAATVPDVLGLDADSARKRIEAAGLVPEVIEQAEPPSPGVESRAGLVWKQSPPGSSSRRAGSVVQVWVNPD